MRIELSDPAQLRSLIQFLELDDNVVVTMIGESEIEIGFVASLNSHAQQTETELRLRDWTSSHPTWSQYSVSNRLEMLFASRQRATGWGR
jgi:hypothetical protein